MTTPALDPAVLAQLTPTAGGFLGLDTPAGTTQPFHATVGSLVLDGTVDTATKDASYDLSAQLPLLGKIKLGSGQGNLASGVPLSYDAGGLGTGTTNLYLKNDNQIWLKYDCTMLGQTQQGDVMLFTI